MLVCALMSAAGCAMGAGVGYQSQSVTVHTDTPVKTTLATSFYEFRLIDTTGIALAAFVNAGRQYNARADAMAEAQRRAQYAAPGETVRVDYSWKPMPILSGLITDIRFRLPLGNPEILGSAAENNKMWGFNLRSEVKSFRMIKSLPMVSAVYLTADFEQWKVMQGATTGFDVFEIDIDLGLSTSYQLGQNLVASGRLGIGALSPLLAVFTPGSTYVNPSLEAEVGWRPVSKGNVGVMLSAVGYVGREFGVDSPDGASIFGTRVSLNAALTFGNQTPKKWKAPETVAGTAKTETWDPSKPASGNICGGNSQAPECTEIVKKVPDDVKILFAACVMATDTAAKKVDFSTQPQNCRTAGDGMMNIARTRTNLTDEQRRYTRIAAAVAYDFAGAGYEISSGNRWGVDQCAMIEQTFNQINAKDGNAGAPLPGKFGMVEPPLKECRTKYTCVLDPGNYTISCTPIQAAPAPAPAPAPGPAPDPNATTPAPPPAPAPAPTTP